MHLTVEHHEVIFGDGSSVYRSMRLPQKELEDFLRKFFRKLFSVDMNRHCHSCTDSCDFGMTLHFGRPFQRNFMDCVPL